MPNADVIQDIHFGEAPLMRRNKMIEGNWNLIGRHGIEGTGRFEEIKGTVTGEIKRHKHASDGSPANITYIYTGSYNDPFASLQWESPGRDAFGRMVMRVDGDKMIGHSYWRVDGKYGDREVKFERA